MTPKEKALDILNKIKAEQGVFKTYIADKNTAIVCVNEIVLVLKKLDTKWHNSEDNTLTSMFDYEVEYWKDVILEISKL
jgi:hypothetical protein